MIDVVFPGNENCPDCGCGVFRPGPRGGISQNIECVQCLSRFNVTHYPAAADHPYEGRPDSSSVCHRCGAERALHHGGKIVWAQRIPSEKDGGGAWREDMFPKVLQ